VRFIEPKRPTLQSLFALPHTRSHNRCNGCRCVDSRLSGSFIYLVKLTLVARISVYAITSAVLPVFRRKGNAPEASFKLPAGEPVAYASAILCVLFLASSSMRDLLQVAFAVVVGVAVFGVTRFTRRALATRTT
jgi:amino acid transporter